jgi:YVTN family beta-propeller protein
MLNKTQLRTFATTAFAAIILNACGVIETTPAQPYDDGVFVINGGNFFDNNGSLSLLQRDSKTATFDIFMKENTRTFAGGISDYNEIDEKGIVLIDNSTDGKDAIEIVNAHTFKTIASIKGEVDNPRKVVKAANNKAYITCWDAFNTDYSYKTGFVVVLDLTTNKITKKILVDKGAESIVVIGTNAYVGNVGSQKTIKVIDILKDEVTATIEVGANPSNFVLDANNKIWLTAGNEKGVTELILFNPSTKMLESKLKAGTNDKKSPSNLSISKDKKTIYYTYNFYDAADGYKLKGEINALNIADGSTKIFINRTYASVGFDNESNQVYTSLIPSYKQAGYIFRYQATGTLVDSVKTEIGPIGFFFK